MEMAQVSPGRTGNILPSVGHKQKRGASTHLQPPAEQATKLGHHRAYVPILSVVQPPPTVSQAQVKPNFVEGGIRRTQVTLPG